MDGLKSAVRPFGLKSRAATYLAKPDLEVRKAPIYGHEKGASPTKLAPVGALPPRRFHCSLALPGAAEAARSLLNRSTRTDRWLSLWAPTYLGVPS
jgi:hypothetical protein